jgi:hypothetical protein
MNDSIKREQNQNRLNFAERENPAPKANEPKSISQIMCEMAANASEPMGKLLRKCPVIQAELLHQGRISLDDLSDDELDRLVEHTFLEDWIDNQDVMRLLHISTRTLQTLRSNGTLPYTRINNKIYYRRQDIQRILADNYTMFRLKNGYGKSR